jgi:hypothetical protein
VLAASTRSLIEKKFKIWSSLKYVWCKESSKLSKCQTLLM